MEFFSKLEAYALRIAIFLLFVVGLAKFLWFEISSIIEYLR